MSFKTAWVTGANGFLGRNLCRYLSCQGFNVIGVGHGHWVPGEAKEWGISYWAFSDITLAALCELASKVAKPYAIFHTAGSSSVSLSIENPYLDYKRTVESTIDVLEFIRLTSPETKLVYPSSAAVYGSVSKGKISEETTLNPVSPYGTHKVLSEILCNDYANHYGIKVSIIRFFSLYGAGLTKQLLWDLCCKFEKQDGDIMLYGTGEEVRDWLHIDDAVRLMLIAMDKACVNSFPVNGGTGIETTVKAIAEKVRYAFKSQREIKFNGMFREGDPKYYQADISRAKDWGWSPSNDWEHGVNRYVQWFHETRGYE